MRPPPIPLDEITGLVLAGGLGRRMDGADKGLQLLEGHMLVTHVVERLAPQVGTLLVSANRNGDTYAGLGYPVVADLIDGFAGPLAGIHAGLNACATPLLSTAPCDTPFLPADLVARLADGLARQDAKLAIARCEGRLHPVFALMRREVLNGLAAHIASGQRKLLDWCHQWPLAIVDFDDAAAFRNFNTSNDLAAYRDG
jgi:molybdenum cofactor guanylyltransferase